MLASDDCSATYISACFSKISNYHNVINLRSRFKKKQPTGAINTSTRIEIKLGKTTSHRRKKYDAVITFQSNEANLTQSVKTLFFYSEKENLEIINTRYS